MADTQWEYAVLSFQEVDEDKDGTWDHRDFYFYGPDGSTEKFHELRDKGALPMLNKLGRDGWEAFHIEATNIVFYSKIGASTYPTNQQAAKNFWLKRPAR